MQKIFFLLFFSFLILISLNVCAQSEKSKFQFGVFAGLSVPQGDFGSTSNEKAGYADLGFCGSIEGALEFVENYYWVSSVSFSLNSLDQESLQNNIQALIPGTTVEAGDYTTAWIMTGLGSDVILSPTIKLYALLQLGLLLPNYPDITISNSSESITQTTSSNPALAYGFGAGINISKFNIGLRYYGGEPEYEQSATYQGAITKVNVEMPTMILEILLGYNF